MLGSAVNNVINIVPLFELFSINVIFRRIFSIKLLHDLLIFVRVLRHFLIIPLNGLGVLLVLAHLKLLRSASLVV